MIWKDFSCLVYFTFNCSPDAAKPSSRVPWFSLSDSICKWFFWFGNLLPDATDQKELSHFRNPVYRDKMMVFPDLTRFTAKYNSLLSDSSVLGYYFHLYIDRRFFKDFIPEIVDFYDETGQITDIKKRFQPFISEIFRLISLLKSILLRNIITVTIQRWILIL